MGGQLKKMEIISYGETDYAEEKKRISVLINPNQYSFDGKQNYSTVVPITDQSTTGNPSGKLPDKFSFKFWFDRTGAFDEKPQDSGDESRGVEVDIDELKLVLFGVNKPNSLLISWGTLNFACSVLSFRVNYVLFDSDGKPLRASIDVSFNEIITTKKIDASKPQGSETKQITAKKGDTLPLLSLQVYGSALYFLSVAKANKLSSFRKLEPGQKIVFPPIGKNR